MILVYSQAREKRGKDGVEQARAGAGTSRSRKGARLDSVGAHSDGKEFQFYFDCSESFWRDLRRRMS